MDMSTTTAIRRSPGLRTHTVTGGDGTRIFVQEAGDRDARPVLFIHGFSQSRLAFRKQFESGLGDELRVVAMDLRGHGASERPVDAYGDSRLWADDVRAVITELELDRPILSGWSYGGLVICDYLARYGAGGLGGVQLVAAITRVGAPVIPYLGSEFVDCIPGFFSTDVETSVAALRTFMRLCAHGGPSAEDEAFFLGYNTIVPPRVRQGLFSRTLVYDDLLASMELPVLITQGREDAIVLPTMSLHNATLLPQAQVSWYDGVGHAPFWESPERFDAELIAFARSIG
jgi:non-heme chloroperoxidase